MVVKREAVVVMISILHSGESRCARTGFRSALLGLPIRLALLREGPRSFLGVFRNDTDFRHIEVVRVAAATLRIREGAPPSGARGPDGQRCRSLGKRLQRLGDPVVK